jgi:hypothetical protein
MEGSFPESFAHEVDSEHAALASSAHDEPIRHLPQDDHGNGDLTSPQTMSQSADGQAE